MEYFSTPITIAIGGILGSILTFIIQKNIERKIERQKELENRINEKLQGEYQNILVWMSLTLNPSNIKHMSIPPQKIDIYSSSNEEIKNFALERLKVLFIPTILYSTDEVLTGLKKFIENPIEANYLETSLGMRNHIWKGNTKINLKGIFPK
ncbi:MAG: hypothetical protein HY842_13415 [Bacteroidetes bacterium]|nr:hypothetical protein [Bacteroidota bacterium]